MIAACTGGGEGPDSHHQRREGAQHIRGHLRAHLYARCPKQPPLNQSHPQRLTAHGSLRRGRSYHPASPPATQAFCFFFKPHEKETPNSAADLPGSARVRAALANTLNASLCAHSFWGGVHYLLPWLASPTGDRLHLAAQLHSSRAWFLPVASTHADTSLPRCWGQRSCGKQRPAPTRTLPTPPPVPGASQGSRLGREGSGRAAGGQGVSGQQVPAAGWAPRNGAGLPGLPQRAGDRRGHRGASSSRLPPPHPPQQQVQRPQPTRAPGWGSPRRRPRHPPRLGSARRLQPPCSCCGSGSGSCGPAASSDPAPGAALPAAARSRAGLGRAGLPGTGGGCPHRPAPARLGASPPRGGPPQPPPPGGEEEEEGRKEEEEEGREPACNKFGLPRSMAAARAVVVFPLQGGGRGPAPAICEGHGGETPPAAPGWVSAAPRSPSGSHTSGAPAPGPPSGSKHHSRAGEPGEMPSSAGRGARPASYLSAAWKRVAQLGRKTPSANTVAG